MYLEDEEELGTDPLETTEVTWAGEIGRPRGEYLSLPETGPLTIRLRVGYSKHPGQDVKWSREMEIALVKPLRLGRVDPTRDIYPEVELSDDLAMEQGVSREHVCISKRNSAVTVEDLGSTNGTLLNGVRLAPYLPEFLHDGDQLQLGKLLIEVGFRAHHRPIAPPQQQFAWSMGVP
jgi:hypothetical protein